MGLHRYVVLIAVCLLLVLGPIYRLNAIAIVLSPAQCFTVFACALMYLTEKILGYWLNGCKLKSLS